MGIKLIRVISYDGVERREMIMGCDIHLFIDRKIKDKWINADNWACNPYFDPKTVDNPDDFERPMAVREVYHGRNYELFGTLARGVRCDVMAIDDARGFPEDAHTLTKGEYESWNSDAHNASWLTLKEIWDYNNSHVDSYITRSGMIDLNSAKELDKHNISPQMWCGATSDKTYVHREWKEKYNPLTELINALTAWMSTSFYYYEKMSMQSEDVRIVFWFDN